MRAAGVGRVVVVLVGALGMVPALASGAAWSVVPSQNGVGPRGALSGVSCTSASVCTAVRDYVNSAGTKLTLAERWNGTSCAPPSAASANPPR